MQERDALLAGLALLSEALLSGKLQAADRESHVADLFTNGGAHSGLPEHRVKVLADSIVDAYPGPALDSVAS